MVMEARSLLRTPLCKNFARLLRVSRYFTTRSRPSSARVTLYSWDHAYLCFAVESGILLDSIDIFA